MAETANPIQLARMIAYMQNPVQGLQMQQQQALADQMMQEGGQQPDSNEMVGNHVVAMNPWGGLARMGERIAGAEMTKQNNQKLAEMLQGGMTPSGGQGQALGNAMGGNGVSNSGVGNAPSMQDIIYSNVAPEWEKAHLALENAGPIKAAEQSQTPVNMNGHMTFMTPPALQQSQPRGNPAITPQSPAGQQALNDMYGQPSAQVNLTSNGQKNVDWNDPAAVEGAKAEATKQGENIGDTEKTYNVVSSQLPRAIQRFQELRQAASKASYGPGLNPPDGGGITTREQFANIFEPQTAKANQMIGQISAQGILPEIGPVIASTGGRGNQFMERMASSASGIRLTDNPQVKAQAVDNVENQYVGNLKSQAAILRNAGRPALSDDQIDAMVAGYKAKNPINPQSPANAASSKIIQYNAQGQRIQ